MRFPDLFKRTAEHLVGSTDSKESKLGKKNQIRGLDDFSPQGLGNMAWAFARQAQLVADVSSRVKNLASNIDNSGRMSVYATAFFDIGEVLLQRLFAAIAEADLRVHDNLSDLKPQDLSNTAWAMAVLGFRHTAFLTAAEKQLLSRSDRFVDGNSSYMTRFKGQELANLLWAFATLDYPLKDGDNLVGKFMLSATQVDKLKVPGIARVFIRQELANIAWSYAVFGIYPESVMTMLYRGLVGVDDERDPKHLCKCFGDTGLQGEAVNSLIYVQLAMEREEIQNGLTLPEGFPDDWNQKSASKRTRDLTETSFELRLSTSKIQRSVSAAFNRIGFEHVEEHVITIDELLDNQGIPLSREPREVLSIDLANLEARVAIEVDGPSHYMTYIDKVPDKGGGYPLLLKNGRMEYQFRMSDERQQMNGPTVFKQRLLQRIGWKTINIPFWEWYRMNGDVELEDAYCRELLDKLSD